MFISLFLIQTWKCGRGTCVLLYSIHEEKGKHKFQSFQSLVCSFNPKESIIHWTQELGTMC